jgi:hypothetical protein
MPLLRINIFGKATFFSCGDMNNLEWDRLVHSAKSEDLFPEYAFFTPGFLSQNNFTTLSGKTISAWTSINEVYQRLLFHTDVRCTMEIKIDGKRVRKFPISQLLPESSLFPFFEWREKEIDLRKNPEEKFKRILLCEDRTGLTGHFRYTIPSFDVNKLRLERTTIHSQNRTEQFLSGIYYAGKRLVGSEDDSVVTGWRCEY